MGAVEVLSREVTWSDVLRDHLVAVLRLSSITVGGKVEVEKQLSWETVTIILERVISLDQSGMQGESRKYLDMDIFCSRASIIDQWIGCGW